MLYIPKTDNYLKILTDNQVKNAVLINFSKSFKSRREKLYFKLTEEHNLRKVAELRFIFLTTPDEEAKILQSNYPDKYVHLYNIEILNLFDPELLLINTIFMIKNILKELLSESKKFNVQTILVLEYKKRNGRKFFYSSV